MDKALTELIQLLNGAEQEALLAIIEEYFRAKRKHPNWPTNDAIHAGAIVSEEAGELIRACLQFTYENGKEENMHKEAIQTGAMALRFLSQ